MSTIVTTAIDALRWTLASTLTALGVALASLGHRTAEAGASIAPTPDFDFELDEERLEEVVERRSPVADVRLQLREERSRLAETSEEDPRLDDYNTDGPNEDDVPGIKHPVTRVDLSEGTSDTGTTPEPYGESPVETRYRAAPSEGATDGSTSHGGMGGYSFTVEPGEPLPFGPDMVVEDTVSEPSSDQGPSMEELDRHAAEELAGEFITVSGIDPPSAPDSDYSALELVEMIADAREHYEARGYEAQKQVQASGLGPLNLQAYEALEPSSDAPPALTASDPVEWSAAVFDMLDAYEEMDL